MNFNNAKYEVSEALVDAAREYIFAASLCSTADDSGAIHINPQGYLSLFNNAQQTAYNHIANEIEASRGWDDQTKKGFLARVNSTSTNNARNC